MTAPQSDAPTGLEYKSTEGVGSAERGGRDATFPLRHAPLPHLDRTGANLSDDEVKSSFAPVGSPAYGNEVQNSNVASLGAANGSETPVVGPDGVPVTRDPKKENSKIAGTADSGTSETAAKKTTTRKPAAD